MDKQIWNYDNKTAEVLAHLWVAGVFDKLREEVLAKTNLTEIFLDQAEASKDLAADEFIDCINILLKTIANYSKNTFTKE